jgi:hypothetical protein
LGEPHKAVLSGLNSCSYRGSAFIGRHRN